MTSFNAPIGFNAAIPFNGGDYVVASGAFPANIVDVLSIALSAVDGVSNVVRRVVRDSDPNRTVGVITSAWMPADQEIGIPEPMGVYTIFISTIVKNTNEMQARHDGSMLVKSIRLLLYRNRDLQIALRGLSETSQGSTERVSRVRVKQQRFIDDNGRKTFLSMSVTQINVDTQIT